MSPPGNSNGVAVSSSRAASLDRARLETLAKAPSGIRGLDEITGGGHEGLFVRRQHAVHDVGAERVALDTVESLFAALPNPLLLRLAALREEHAAADAELARTIAEERRAAETLTADRARMGKSRQAFASRTSRKDGRG